MIPYSTLISWAVYDGFVKHGPNDYIEIRYVDFWYDEKNKIWFNMHGGMVYDIERYTAPHVLNAFHLDRPDCWDVVYSDDSTYIIVTLNILQRPCDMYYIESDVRPF